ncbi:hypothetical protein H6A30_14295 [Bacteroides caecigallinarum]|uniref:hypothetical protein n=1 Tax=Bacteroides caecigallinarum TaxID=1411144 RepID=UPI00195DFAE9|nr:hypothetical protein [Bacteroides caecigallinarum]MBM6891395.1 hypothetical protein [Bacteroides caecigallinarum]
MKMYPILLLTACLSAGCGGTGVSGNAAEGTNLSGTDERKPTATVCNETRTVSLKDPYMQNAQVLTIECLPGWQLVGKVDLEDFQQANGTPNAQIKGSDGARQLGFYTEMARSYYDENDGVATGQRHPLLRSMKWPYTTAEDYLQYVVKTQFPDARSIELKDVQTYDKLPDAMRQYADKYGQILLRNFQQGLANSAMGSSFTQIRGAKADAAAIVCVIKLEDGKEVYHVATACFFILDVRMPYGTMRTIDRRLWNVLELTTFTAADEKSLDVAGTEASRMKGSIQLNPQYSQAIVSMQQGRIEQIKQNVRAGIIRNQQQAARISEQLRQNAAEISDIQMSMYESTSAMQDRVTQLHSEAIRGVNPYVSSDGTVVDIPIGSGTQVWSTSDAGTILSSDSYFFNPNIGSTIEYQQMQLLR